MAGTVLTSTGPGEVLHGVVVAVIAAVGDDCRMPSRVARRSRMLSGRHGDVPLDTGVSDSSTVRCSLLWRTVHALHLPVGPGMIDLCQPVLDAMFMVDAAENVYKGDVYRAGGS